MPADCRRYGKIALELGRGIEKICFYLIRQNVQEKIMEEWKRLF